MVSLGLVQFGTGHIWTRSQMRYHVGKFVWRYSVDGKLKKKSMNTGMCYGRKCS
jgi:hypothetical protein